MSETFRYLEDERYSVVPMTKTYDDKSVKDYLVRRDNKGYIGWIHEAIWFFARHREDEDDTYKRFFSINAAIKYIVQHDQIHNG